MASYTLTAIATDQVTGKSASDSASFSVESVATGFPSATTTGPAAAGYTNLVPTAGATIEGTPYPSWMVEQADGSYLVEGRAFTSPVSCYVANTKFVGCSWLFGGNPNSNIPFQFRAGGCTLSYCEVGGLTDTAADRACYCIYVQTDLAWNVDHCNVHTFQHGINGGGNNGTVTNSYFHDPLYYTGDHTNCIYLYGDNTHIHIEGNTFLNQLTENSCIAQFQDGAGPITDLLISNNLIAGGGYSLYLGNYGNGAITDMVVENNQFSTRFYADCGYYGIKAYAPTFNAGNGNVWSGNTWADGPNAGQPVT